MPATNFRALHVKLSRLIQDPVSVATSDGVIIAALRTDYLNRANDYVKNILVGLWKNPQVKKQLEPLMSGLIASSATATVSGSVTLPTDYYHWLSYEKVSGGGKAYWIEPSRKPQLDQKRADHGGLFFTIVGSTLYAYEDNAAIVNGAHILRYVKSDIVTNAEMIADSNDLTLNNLWWEALIFFAASFYFAEKGEFDMSGNLMNQAQSMMKAILG